VWLPLTYHTVSRNVGNGRRFVLDSDADRTITLELLRENIVLYGVALIGYCLMSNHIHLVAIWSWGRSCGLGPAQPVIAQTAEFSEEAVRAPVPIGGVLASQPKVQLREYPD
jgi:Transposase IS200 like